jgi:hypothetical protein
MTSTNLFSFEPNLAFGVRLFVLVIMGFDVKLFKVYSPDPGISSLLSGIKEA